MKIYYYPILQHRFQNTGTSWVAWRRGAQLVVHSADNGPVGRSQNYNVGLQQRNMVAVLKKREHIHVLTTLLVFKTGCKWAAWERKEKNPQEMLAGYFMYVLSLKIQNAIFSLAPNFPWMNHFGQIGLTIVSRDKAEKKIVCVRLYRISM